ncbi:MAG TPA: competence protein CoiA family protein [Mucilaginibacter sp.]|jgi:ssDNA-binding Zn-finger/Zn-ribbon topoisomerase 1
MDIRLPFGLQNGQLVDISSVESGLACNCVCPSCGQRLVAKKGDWNQHHFAHHNNVECFGALETALHIYAKNILEEHRRIVLPAVYLDKSRTLIFPSTEVTFEKVVLEKRPNNIIPDIIVFINGKPLLIEIAVTHFVDKFKEAKIFELGYSAIEINVKSLLNSAHYKVFGYRDFEKLLIEGTDFKRWINNLKQNLISEQLKKLVTSRKVLHSKLYEYPTVDNCPINKRIWKSGHKKGQSYASVNDDCWNCPYGDIIRKQKYFNSGMMINEGKIREVNCSGHRQEEIDELITKFKRAKN